VYTAQKRLAVKNTQVGVYSGGAEHSFQQAFSSAARCRAMYVSAICRSDLKELFGFPKACVMKLQAVRTRYLVHRSGHREFALPPRPHIRLAGSGPRWVPGLRQSPEVPTWLRIEHRSIERDLPTARCGTRWARLG